MTSPSDGASSGESMNAVALVRGEGEDVGGLVAAAVEAVELAHRVAVAKDDLGGDFLRTSPGRGRRRRRGAARRR